MSNDLDDLGPFLKQAAALAEKQPPYTSLLIDEEGGCVDLVLDTKRATICEWIKGEGADICLYRDRDTGKVVGCHLPLYQKELRVSRIEKPKSKAKGEA